MLVKYNGPKTTAREIRGIVFSEQTGRSQIVTDPEVLEDLLTYPGDQFGPDPEDPMVEILGADDAIKVGLSGITSLEILATLTDQELDDLTAAAEVDIATAAAWILAAGEF